MRAPAPAATGRRGAPVALCDLALRAPRLTRRATAVHGRLARRRQRGPMARWFGASLLLLETVGRHSGEHRTTPLAYLPDGERLVVVPANGGAPTPPAWWLNLQAAGEAVALLEGGRRRVCPRVAQGDEHARLWRSVAAVAPLDHYQRRAGRPLPVVVLE